MGPLSEPCRERVRTLFATDERAYAERLLETECGANLPLMGDAGSAALDRIRFAAIRLSAGRATWLREAVRLAQVDWRDLLVAAGFADDVHAHERWQPRPLPREMLESWMAGGQLGGVEFLLGAPVRLCRGHSVELAGAIVSLLALEPEPRYLVELGSGEDVEAYQRWLKLI